MSSQIEPRHTRIHLQFVDFVLLLVRIHDYCFHRHHWSACGQDGLRKFDTIEVVFHGENEGVEVFGPLRRLKGSVLEFASYPNDSKAKAI
jgi:hypothetical protein